MPRPIAQRHAPRVIRYGPGARNIIDFFPGDRDGPIVVFIHGGYWQALDGSSFSHLAARAECPRHQRRHSKLRSCVPVSPSISIIEADADGHARTGAAGAAARHQRPFRRRASCGLHAGDRLAGVRCVVARTTSSLRPTPFRACSTWGRWSKPRSTRPCGSIRQPRGRRARCSGKRRRAEVSMRWSAETKARNISGKAGPSSTLGRGRRRDPVRRGSRRQSFHRDCAAGRSAIADGGALEGIGGPLGFSPRGGTRLEPGEA